MKKLLTGKTSFFLLTSNSMKKVKKDPEVLSKYDIVVSAFTILKNSPVLNVQWHRLILDECHERSVDADVLCLLCRRLLTRFPRLRIVLMSATAHNDLLRAYFAEKVGWAEVSDPLHVGGRRFPVQICHLDENSLTELTSLPERLRKAARGLVDKCSAIPSVDLVSGSDERRH